jgi:hypothetical protein
VTETPTRARRRPEPAGEPRPTPVEDVPDVATPAPREPAPEPPDPRPAEEVLAEYQASLRDRDPALVDIRARVASGELGIGALLTGLTPQQARDEALDVIAATGQLDDLRDDHPLSAPEALAEVMRRVPAIAKGRTSDQGYRFRGIDDVYSSLHDLFAEVGLVVLPRPIERIGEVRLVGAKQDRSQYVTHLLVEFRFLAADGTSETCSAWGEGSDMGDKATQKAHSQAIKSALLETFLIPTEDSARDEPDATNPEPGRAFTAEEQERAGTALIAAGEATTLDALVAVGRRANAGGLLDVPIVGDAGRIAPLRFHLDARRAQLEAQVQS